MWCVCVPGRESAMCICGCVVRVCVQHRQRLEMTKQTVHMSGQVITPCSNNGSENGNKCPKKCSSFWNKRGWNSILFKWTFHWRQSLEAENRLALDPFPSLSFVAKVMALSLIQHFRMIREFPAVGFAHHKHNTRNCLVETWKKIKSFFHQNSLKKQRNFPSNISWNIPFVDLT